MMVREASSRLAGSAVTLKSDQATSEGLPLQLGYMVAPRMLATCWHRALLSSVGKRRKDEDELQPLLVNGEKNFILSVWANSQADCAAIELAKPVPNSRVVRLGTIWNGGEPGVQYWIRHKYDGQPLVNQPATLNLSPVNHHTETHQAFLLLHSNASSEDMKAARGSPVILSDRNLCLGHVSGSWAAGNAYEVCPAFWLHQIAPWCVPYHNWFTIAERPYFEQLIAELGEDIVIRVLCEQNQDYEDLNQTVRTLHGKRAGDWPGLRLEKVSRNEKKMLFGGNIILVILTKNLEKESAFLELRRKLFETQHPATVYASVAADDDTTWLSNIFYSSGYQLSRERPLHWIFDRRQRLAAWSAVLESLRLQIAVSRRSHRELMLEHGA